MRHILFLFALISWATCTMAQTDAFSFYAEVYNDRLEIYISSQIDEDVQVNFVAIQDVVFPLIQGDTLMSGYETIGMSIPVDSAEYHSYELQASIGGNLRTKFDMSKTLTIPAKKGNVLFLQPSISGRLHFIVNQYYEGDKVFVYDLSGRQHFQKNVQVGSNIIQTNLPTGLYLVVIQRKGLSESFKVFIR